jgi:hypothetical protein
MAAFAVIGKSLAREECVPLSERFDSYAGLAQHGFP